MVLQRFTDLAYTAEATRTASALDSLFAAARVQHADIPPMQLKTAAEVKAAVSDLGVARQAVLARLSLTTLPLPVDPADNQLVASYNNIVGSADYASFVASLQGFLVSSDFTSAMNSSDSGDALVAAAILGGLDDILSGAGKIVSGVSNIVGGVAQAALGGAQIVAGLVLIPSAIVAGIAGAVFGTEICTPIPPPLNAPCIVGVWGFALTATIATVMFGVNLIQWGVNNFVSGVNSAVNGGLTMIQAGVGDIFYGATHPEPVCRPGIIVYNPDPNRSGEIIYKHEPFCIP